jgi:hypothetical protein
MNERKTDKLESRRDAPQFTRRGGRVQVRPKHDPPKVTGVRDVEWS